MSIEDQYLSITNVDFINQSLKFASDSEDEKMRIINCYLQPIIEELIKDPKFNYQVLELVRLSKLDVANLSQIFLENPVYKRYADEKLRDISIRIKNYIYYSFEDLEKAYTYHGEQYIPSIFVLNLQTADSKKIPIISVGVEVDSESFPN